jgi:predicted ATPase
MFRTLILDEFKNFQRAKLPLSPFTLLVGANASGKSNIREAFRFINGVARGYSLAEIVGEKWIDGGVRVWHGVRGGAPHLIRFGSERMSLQTTFTAPAGDSHRPLSFDYRLDVALREDLALRVVREHLKESGRYIYDTHPDGEPRGGAGPTIKARIKKFGGGHPPDDTFLEDRPILGQFASSAVATEAVKRIARSAIDYLNSMAFLDLSPHAAREASQAGISTLGDRGENLSSVLREICAEPGKREQLTSWVRALTPTDAVDFKFAVDANGRVMAELVEARGAEIPLTAASDGTVRFLAMIAALMNPARPHLLFFEELENGIHPNRIFLLLDLISQSVTNTSSQIVATSHSPQLLVHAYRTANARPCLVYRAGGGAARVVDVKNSPALRAVLSEDDPAALMAAGWFEDVAAFLDEEEDL